VPTLIFVHGACVRDAPWWWSRMTEPLADHGIASVAVPVPSCGETEDGLGDLYADVEAARQAIAEAEAPVVLCGHSYFTDRACPSWSFPPGRKPIEGMADCLTLGAGPAGFWDPSTHSAAQVSRDM
jgi:hypothetical protein